MGEYLDKFRTTITALQRRQIGAILTKRQQTGQIRTVDEFKLELEQLTEKLSIRFLVPTLEIFLASSNTLIDTETFNFMLERIVDDLTSAFSEAQSIADVLAIHNNLIVDIVLGGITLALNELDSRVSLFEFLQTNRAGFNDAQFNTFKETRIFNTPRTNLNAGLVYSDVREKDLVPISEDAAIDVIGERLILGPNDEKEVEARTVRQILDSETQQTELHTAIDETNATLQNIVDRQTGTYWLYSTLLANQRPSGVTTKLEFLFDGTAEVNSIIIEPAILLPITLTRISYLDGNGELQNIDISSVLIDRPVSITFSPITTSQMVLSFNQSNSTEIQFELKGGTDLFGRRNDIDVALDMDDISEDLEAIFSSRFLLDDILGVSADPDLGQLKFWEYQIGFDNIRFRFTDYDARSIFVSAEKTVTGLGQAALKTVESRPVSAAGTTAITNTATTYLQSSTNPPTLGVWGGSSWSDESGVDQSFHASIEYTLYKQDFNTNGALLGTTVVPLLPTGAEIIPDERLVLSEYSSTATIPDIGSPRFYTYLDVPETATNIGSADFRLYDSDIRGKLRVYKNGTEIPNKDEFTTSDSGFYIQSGNDKVDLPGQGDPMSIKIRVESPVVSDIYTVTYVPDLSNTYNLPTNEALAQELRIIDLAGDRSARLVPENIVVFAAEKGSDTVATSLIYMSIITRRNSSIMTITPAVEEYLLMTGASVAGRFVSDFNG